MSTQGLLQASIRASTGTAHPLQGDWLALFVAAGITTGSFNERMLRWLNAQLSASHTALPVAQQAFAAEQGVADWDAVTTITLGASIVGGLVLDGAYLVLNGSYLVLT
jgi:hypothetical protein